MGSHAIAVVSCLRGAAHTSADGKAPAIKDAWHESGISAPERAGWDARPRGGGGVAITMYTLCPNQGKEAAAYVPSGRHVTPGHAEGLRLC